MTSEKQNASGGSDSTPRLLICRANAVLSCPSFSSRTSSSKTSRGLLFFVLRGLDHCRMGPSLWLAGRTLNHRSLGTEPFVYGIFHKYEPCQMSVPDAATSAAPAGRFPSGATRRAATGRRCASAGASPAEYADCLAAVASAACCSR